MRDLERLLTGAYPEGLRDVPPAPVRKSAVRDKTFEKLGLERPKRQPLPHEQWSQAEPVVKRRRPWAMWPPAWPWWLWWARPCGHCPWRPPRARDKAAPSPRAPIWSAR